MLKLISASEDDGFRRHVLGEKTGAIFNWTCLLGRQILNRHSFVTLYGLASTLLVGPALCYRQILNINYVNMTQTNDDSIFASGGTRVLSKRIDDKQC